MFLDASVIVAILGGETGWQALRDRIEAHDSALYISPLVRFETVQALARKQSEPNTRPSAATINAAARILDAFVARLKIEEIPVSPKIGELALDASARYGKLVGHRAALNFGDCFAYGCARSLGVPLLSKGEDFSRTDLS